MLIALEGCDGTGKSSLAQSIVDQIKKQFPDDEVRLLHSGPLDTDPYSAYLAPLQDYVPGGGVHYVLDRWHVGEMVYGPLYREKSQIDSATWIWLELWFASRGMTLVHVTQTLDVIRARLEERGEDFLQPEHVAHVRTEFQRVTRDCLTCVTEVYPDGDTSREVAGIIGQASFDEEYAIGLPKSYIGSPHAKYLIVGDSLKPTGNNGAKFLWEAIDDYSSPEYFGFDTAWHALSVVDESDLDLTRAVFDAWCVTALGYDAQLAVDAVKPPHRITGSVPLPQTVRFFNNDKKTDYAELILNNFRIGEDNSSWPN